MNGTLYTPEELQFIKDNYALLGTKKCAEHLHRSYYAVQKKAADLGIRVWKNIPWTFEEKDFLKENYIHIGAAACAVTLGRGRSAVEKMANQLGLKYGTKLFIADGYAYYAPSEAERYAVHRLILEHKLGRNLLPTEVAHHINENTLDNRAENLEVMTRAEHINAHREKLMHSKNSSACKERDSLALQEIVRE